MKKKKNVFSMGFLGKFTLIVALFVGGGVSASADEDIIVVNGKVISQGWTNGAGNSNYNYTIEEDGLIASSSSYSRLQSSDNFTFSNKRIIVKAKRIDDNESYVILYSGYSSTSAKFGYKSSTAGSGYEIYSKEDYIELISDNLSVSNAKLDFRSKNVKIISIIITDNAELVLDENNPTALVKGTRTENVKFKYTPSTAWNTICVPFQLKSGSSYEHLTSIFGEGWKAYTLNGYDNGTISFANAVPNSYTSINANTPLLVYAPNSTSQTNGIVLSSNVSISYSDGISSPFVTSIDGAIFKGNYAPIPKGSFTGDMYGVTSTGQVRPGDGVNANIKGYRAYFTGINPPTTEARPTIVLVGDDDLTDIGFVKMIDEEATDVYTLSGQKVQKAGKGIYIVNGRKVIIK